jgi:hypothetical protein
VGMCGCGSLLAVNLIVMPPRLLVSGYHHVLWQCIYANASVDFLPCFNNE